MGEKKQCAKMTWESWLMRAVQCPYRAKYGDYCGVHSPEKKKERAAARGPTQYESDRAAEKAERKRVEALESSHAELLEEVGRLKKLAHRGHTYCEDGWYSCPKAEDGCLDERAGDDCNCGADEHNAEVETARATEEKS